MFYTSFTLSSVTHVFIYSQLVQLHVFHVSVTHAFHSLSSVTHVFHLLLVQLHMFFIYS